MYIALPCSSGQLLATYVFISYHYIYTLNHCIYLHIYLCICIDSYGGSIFIWQQNCVLALLLRAAVGNVNNLLRDIESYI